MKAIKVDFTQTRELLDLLHVFEHAHNRGIPSGFLKTDSIMLEWEPHAIIISFGEPLTKED